MREKSLTFDGFFFTLKALLLCAVPLFRSSSSDLAADYNVSLCGQLNSEFPWSNSGAGAAIVLVLLSTSTPKFP